MGPPPHYSYAEAQDKVAIAAPYGQQALLTGPLPFTHASFRLSSSHIQTVALSILKPRQIWLMMIPGKLRFSHDG